jgi:hypothetical protein
MCAGPCALGAGEHSIITNAGEGTGVSAPRHFRMVTIGLLNFSLPLDPRYHQ